MLFANDLFGSMVPFSLVPVREHVMKVSPAGLVLAGPLADRHVPACQDGLQAAEVSQQEALVGDVAPHAGEHGKELGRARVQVAEGRGEAHDLGKGDWREF